MDLQCYYGTTIHRKVKDLEALTEKELAKTKKQLAKRENERKVLLILPSTVGDATNNEVISHMTRIITTLQEELAEEGRPLDHVIVGIDQARTREEYEQARRPFLTIPRVVTTWNDHPRMKELYKELAEAHDIKEIPPGKGRNVWTLLGLRHLLAPKADVLMHDCDIKPAYYTERVILSLAKPLLDGKTFAKGYYVRLAEENGKVWLSGRVKRLLINPLLDALLEEYEKSVAIKDFLQFHQATKYQLSGEVGMSGSLLESFPSPWDWGLEMATLASIYNLNATVGIVDLGKYDHKHSPESPDNPQAGLYRMAREVAKTLLRAIYVKGQWDIIAPSRSHRILSAYTRHVEAYLKKYATLSAEEGWTYEQEQEKKRATLFEQALSKAFDTVTEHPGELSPLQPWERVEAQRPGIVQRIKEFYQSEDISLTTKSSLRSHRKLSHRKLLKQG